MRRTDFEAWRHGKIVNAHLENVAQRPWMAGERYTLLDRAVWG